MPEGSTINIDYSSDSFKAMDANNDNFVTTEEMKDYLKKKGFGPFSELAAKTTIEGADIDNNGKMSLGEFALFDSQSKEIVKTDFEKTYKSEEATKLFNQYDTNKDDKITQEEIKEVDKSMDKANDKSKGLSTGAIIGIIVGAVCLLGLIVGLIVYFSRKNKKEAQKSEQNGKDKKANKGNSYDLKDISYETRNSLVNINEKSKGKSR